MKQPFTFSMLSYQISKNLKCEKLTDPRVNEKISTWKYWNVDSPDSNVLYFVTPEMLLQYWKQLQNRCVICRALPKEEMPNGRINLLLIQGKTDLEIANILQDVFSGFTHWKEHIHDTLNETNDVSQTLEICAQYLNLDVCIVNDDYAILGACHQSVFWDYDKHGNKIPRLSMDFVQELIQEKEFLSAKKHDGVFLYKTYSTDYQSGNYSYCYNLRIRGEYFGRLATLIDMKHDQDGAKQYITYLGQFFEDYFLRRHQNQSGGIFRQEFLDGLKTLLTGEHISENDIEYLLQYNSWNPYNDYQVIKLEFLQNVPTAFYCAHIEQLFPDCVVIVLDDAVYCIRNLNTTDKIGLPPGFSKFLSEAYCKAGISNPIDQIFGIHWCQKEADIALEVGKKEKPHFWYHYFHDYSLLYLASQATGTLSTERAIHPALYALYKYDKTYDTELLKTLEIYLLCEGNSTHTADTLYIHRTTLIHRISRITQLTGIDFDDHNTKLHLRFSFYLLRSDATLCSKWAYNK